MNIQRIGFIVTVVGAVAAVYALLKSTPNSQVQVLQPSTGGSTIAPIAPATRVFNFGDGGTGSSPYMFQNIPPLPDFKKTIAAAIKDAQQNPPGSDCCCVPSNPKMRFSDGTSTVTPDASRQIEKIYETPADKATMGKTAQQLATVQSDQQPAVNQSTGVWASYNYDTADYRPADSGGGDFGPGA